MEQFVWHPGIGIDADALKRLYSNSRRPNEPMGEAWFMGNERRMFNALERDLSALTVNELQEPLESIASGTSSFGPIPEWREWYHYLIPRLVPRCHECFVSSLLESLVTGFMALYPNGIHTAPYPGYRNDVLLTLGRCMMAPECWDGDNLVLGAMLHRSDNNPHRVWGWWDACGDFSASMFFCLKYLPDPLVDRWFRSVLDIPSPHWRAQVMAWLVGANGLLTGRLLWPSELKIGARPAVDWESSHCLKPTLAADDTSGAQAMSSLLPESARVQALDQTRLHFTEDVFLDWLLSIARIPYLEAELAEIPSTFEQMYVRRS